VDYEGTVLAVDRQDALFEEWLLSKAGLGFDESGMYRVCDQLVDRKRDRRTFDRMKFSRNQRFSIS
jgi:hypothetical protein